MDVVWKGSEANAHVHKYWAVDCPKLEDKDNAAVSLGRCQECSSYLGKSPWDGVLCQIMKDKREAEDGPEEVKESGPKPVRVAAPYGPCRPPDSWRD